MCTAEETSLAELDRTRARGRLAVTEVTGGTHGAQVAVTEVTGDTHGAQVRSCNSVLSHKSYKFGLINRRFYRVQ